MDLFVAPARGARPGFALTAENMLAVGSICTALDGLPLALDLAAAHAICPRQQIIRRAILWSCDLLSPTKQHLLARLSVIYRRLEIGRSRGLALEAWRFIMCSASILTGSPSPPSRMRRMCRTIWGGMDGAFHLKSGGDDASRRGWVGGSDAVRHRDSAYQAVLAWALAGIALKQAAAPLVASAASTMAGAVVLIMIGGMLRQRRTQNYHMLRAVCAYPAVSLA